MCVRLPSPSHRDLGAHRDRPTPPLCVGAGRVVPTPDRQDLPGPIRDPGPGSGKGGPRNEGSNRTVRPVGPPRPTRTGHSPTPGPSSPERNGVDPCPFEDLGAPRDPIPTHPGPPLTSPLASHLHTARVTRVGRVYGGTKAPATPRGPEMDSGGANETGRTPPGPRDPSRTFDGGQESSEPPPVTRPTDGRDLRRDGLGHCPTPDRTARRPVSLVLRDQGRGKGGATSALGRHGSGPERLRTSRPKLETETTPTSAPGRKGTRAADVGGKGKDFLTIVLCHTRRSRAARSRGRPREHTSSERQWTANDQTPSEKTFTAGNRRVGPQRTPCTTGVPEAHNPHLGPGPWCLSPQDRS